MISFSKKPCVRILDDKGAIDFSRLNSELSRTENVGKFVYINTKGQLKFTARDEAAKGRSKARKDMLPAKLEAAARELSSANPGVLSSALALFKSHARRNLHHQTYVLLQNGAELQKVASQLAAAQDDKATAEKAPTASPRQPRNVPPLVKRQAQQKLSARPVGQAAAAVDTRFFHSGFLAAADFLNASLKSADPEMWSEQLRRLVFERIPRWNPELQVRNTEEIATAIRWLLSETEFADRIDPAVALELAKLI